MSGIAKGTKSKRKREASTDRSIAVPRVSDVPFMHQASAGDTGFNLAALTIPDDSGSFLNPSSSQIQSLTQAGLRGSLELHNGEGKILAPGVSYEVSGLQINFIGFIALEGEIFYGVVKNAPRNNTSFMDGTQVLAMGFLPVGETQFNIGQQFKWNHNSTMRVGAVRVERNRAPQYRNSDNLTNGLLDGDFAEIRAGTSQFSTLIQFNDAGVLLPGNLLEFVVVYGTQVFVDRESGSLRSEVEVQASQVLRIAETVAALAGVPLTDFLTANPSAVQLKQFGDLILALQSAQNTLLAENLSSLRQYTLTVTGTNWTTIRAVGVPYRTLDGAWRFRFNINGSISSTVTGINLTVSDITSKNVANSTQSYSVHVAENGVDTRPLKSKYILANSNVFTVESFSGVFNRVSIAGDIELEAKPVFVA